MDRVLEGINNSFVLAFIEDVLVYSPTLAEHVVHLREVLERIKAAGVTINPDKVNAQVLRPHHLPRTVQTLQIQGVSRARLPLSLNF